MVDRVLRQIRERRRRVTIRVLGALVALQGCVALGADSAPGASATAGEACPIPEIESAAVVGESPWLLKPGRTLQVRLKDFDAWLDCRKKSTSVMPTLYLDHSARPEMLAAADPPDKSLRFTLRLNEGNRERWVAAVANSVKGQAIAVGLGTSAIETSAVEQTEVKAPQGASFEQRRFEVTLADRRSQIGAWAYVGVLVFGSLLIAWLTGLVRDQGPLAPGVNEWNRSFSLARTQLFLWTLAVFGVAGVAWIWTGLLPELNTETLSLLGISAGTTGLSHLIDQSQQSPVQAASKLFISDLINDGTGASIHRFQAVLANAGLAAIFVTESLHSLDFYAIPPSWAALMLLSSGLYLGLKTQEPH